MGDPATAHVQNRHVFARRWERALVILRQRADRFVVDVRHESRLRVKDKIRALVVSRHLFLSERVFGREARVLQNIRKGVRLRARRLGVRLPAPEHRTARTDRAQDCRRTRRHERAPPGRAPLLDRRFTSVHAGGLARRRANRRRRSRARRRRRTRADVRA